MRPVDLIIKGYAKRDGGVWVAVCLDYCLAAQADTAAEAVEKLARQVREYIRDALMDENQEHAVHFLRRRKAPISQWATYYWFILLHTAHLLKEEACSIRGAQVGGIFPNKHTTLCLFGVFPKTPYESIT